MIIGDRHIFPDGTSMPKEKYEQTTAECADIARQYEACLEERGEVLCQLWATHDIDRPVSHEFCSLHTSEQQRRDFHERYTKSLPQQAPDEYLALACDDNFKRIPAYRCRVDARTFRRIKNSGIGLWCVTTPAKTIDAIALIPPRDFISLTEGLMPTR